MSQPFGPDDREPREPVETHRPSGAAEPQGMADAHELHDLPVLRALRGELVRVAQDARRGSAHAESGHSAPRHTGPERRPAPRSRGPRWRRPAALLLAALLVATGVAVASRTIGDKQYVRDERRAVAVVNHAFGSVNRRDPSCRPKGSGMTRPRLVPGAPSATVRALFGALRRPQRPDERGTRLLAEANSGITAVYPESVRRLRDPNGHAWLLIVARGGTPRTAFTTPRCWRAYEYELARLLPAEPPHVQELAHRTMRQLVDEQREARRLLGRLGEVVAVVPAPPARVARARGVVVHGQPVGQLRRMAVLGTGAPRIPGSLAVRTDMAVVDGFAPDPVATVEMRFPRIVSQGPHRPPHVYPRAVRRLVRPHDNLISVTVPRSPPDALVATVVWRDAHGRVLRTFRLPG